MKRATGAEILHERGSGRIQERNAYRRIADIGAVRIAVQGAAGTTAGQAATAFGRVIALAGQRPRCFAAEAGDDRKAASASRDTRVDHARQQSIERKDQRYNVADDGVTKLEARLDHATIKAGRQVLSLIGIKRTGPQFRAS
jgi:hypothetical protein